MNRKNKLSQATKSVEIALDKTGSFREGNPADIDAADMETLAHVSRADRVTAAMWQLLSKLGLARQDHTFYALRHLRLSAAIRVTKWQYPLPRDIYARPRPHSLACFRFLL